MRVQHILRLTMLGGISLLAACGDSGTEPTSQNPFGDAAFTATVTGDIATTFDGVAAFGTSTAADEFGFALAMFPEEEDDELQFISFYRDAAGVPAGNQHTIGNADAEETQPETLYALAFITSGTETYACMSTGGTTTFTSRTTDRLEGTYSVTMDCTTLDIDAEDEEVSQITIAGTYKAIRGEVEQPDL